MLIINERQIEQCYHMTDAIRDIRLILKSKERGELLNPHRTVLDFPERRASALYMPSADLAVEMAGIKIATVFPDNPAMGIPTIQGLILLTDVIDGRHIALMNAFYLTRLRTGALSGIATDSLARNDSRTLTVIGAGAMAFEQVLAVLAVRDIERIILVNRTPEKAAVFAERLRAFGVHIPSEVEPDVAAAVRQADIICCVTRSDEPVFDGRDLQPGTHINGVGSYLSSMREVDEETILRANKIAVDGLAGVKAEAGELIHAAKGGKWSFDQVHAELDELANGKKPGRESAEEITFFKSVGAAYFDLAVARGVYTKAQESGMGTEMDI